MYNSRTICTHSYAVVRNMEKYRKSNAVLHLDYQVGYCYQFTLAASAVLQFYCNVICSLVFHLQMIQVRYVKHVAPFTPHFSKSSLLKMKATDINFSFYNSVVTSRFLRDIHNLLTRHTSFINLFSPVTLFFYITKLAHSFHRIIPMVKNAHSFKISVNFTENSDMFINFSVTDNV